MVLELKGDIRDTPIYTIAHGVNCQGVMGSGVAKALYEKWTEVKTEYLEFHKNYREKHGYIDKDFLGLVLDIQSQAKDNKRHKRIINMHTQLNFGSGDKQYIDYAALMVCFSSLYRVDAIAVPKIGAGLAGGDWDIIKNIMVSKTQEKGIDLVIYSLT